MRIIILSIVTLIGFYALFGCSETVSSNQNIVFPDTNVSFQNYVQPFMRITCSIEGCHSDNSQAGGRRMTDYASFFEAVNAGLVIPGNPEASRLIQILEHPELHSGNVYWKATDNQVKGMKTWIKEGAKPN